METDCFLSSNLDVLVVLADDFCLADLGLSLATEISGSIYLSAFMTSNALSLTGLNLSDLHT